MHRCDRLVTSAMSYTFSKVKAWSWRSISKVGIDHRGPMFVLAASILR